MLLSIPICGQSYPKLVIINKQHYFKRTVPKGNYSGITWLENNYNRHNETKSSSKTKWNI